MKGIVFTHEADNTADRTIRVDFRPRIVLVFGRCSVFMGGRFYGGGVWVFTHLEGNIQGCFGFVVATAMTIGLRSLWVDMSSELEFWLFCVPLIGNGGALMVLFTDLGTSVLGARLRDVAKRRR